MTNIDKNIEAELLKLLSKGKKINLMTFQTQKIKELFHITNCEFIQYIQRQFLESNLSFRYKFLSSRNGIKIVEIYQGCNNKEKIEKYKTIPLITSEISRYILNQFDEFLSEEDLLDVMYFYSALLKNIENNEQIFVSLDDKLIDIIYLTSKNIFNSKQHIQQIIANIKKYGYCMTRNKVIYWKLYNNCIDLQKNDIKTFFTVIDKKNNKEYYNNEEEKIITNEFTVQDAFNLLAEKLGISSIDKKESKLEEIISLTNELIYDFNEMEDWEKLMNWKQFISNWNMIIGDVISDNS